jgi:hypothetical protein
MVNSGYGYGSDNIRHLDKVEIKQLYGEDNIFRIIFEDDICLDKKYLSPFRKDNHPSCTFIIGRNGSLLFCDWADVPCFRDCIQAVMESFNLTLADSLSFIDNYFKSTEKNRKKVIKEYAEKQRQSYPITFKSRKFIKKDIEYWKQYNITPIQLAQDKVYAVDSFKVYSSRLNGFSYVDCKKEICYVYTEFKDHQKVYFPNRKKLKWFTNCTKNDVGNIRNIETTGNYLIITKSYKDCRIIRNYGYVNTIWFQNEGMFPDIQILQDLIVRFKRIYVFFDNDSGGKNAASKLDRLLRELRCFPYLLFSPLEESKDIGEIYQNYGNQFTKKFLDESINTDFSSFVGEDIPY